MEEEEGDAPDGGEVIANEDETPRQIAVKCAPPAIPIPTQACPGRARNIFFVSFLKLEPETMAGDASEFRPPAPET